MAETHVPVLVRMTVEQKDQLFVEAKKRSRTLTGEINERLRISLAAQGPTLQAILAREAFADKTPGIAPSAPITPPSTGPDGQPVKLSDVDVEMLRIFHALPIHKQLALVSLFK